MYGLALRAHATPVEAAMVKLIALMVGLFLASLSLAQPQPWLDQQRARTRQKQLELENGQRRQQQQQLDKERFRAEHGWELHPRSDAPWKERQREYELRQEFQRP